MCLQTRANLTVSKTNTVAPYMGMPASGGFGSVRNGQFAWIRLSTSSTRVSSTPMSRVALPRRKKPPLAHGYPLGARVAQVGLIDVLYTGLTLKRQAEVERSQARIATALYGRPG